MTVDLDCWVHLLVQVVQGKKASRSADLWAFGCVVYQVFAGRVPIWAKSEQEASSKTVSFKVERSFPRGFPAPAKGNVGVIFI